jgi:nitroreductase
METLTSIRNTSTSMEAPVLDLIANRRSKRAYSSQPVAQEKITSLFEAARWAPSSMNEQPWVYIYATKDQPELWQKIFDALNESNQVWAKEAPLLIVSMVRKNLIRNGRPNGAAKYDLGGANAFLSLQATSMGLNVHQMGGYNADKIRTNLNIHNEELELGVIMAIGYLGDAEALPENLKQRELSPRERYLQSAFVMNKSF